MMYHSKWSIHDERKVFIQKSSNRVYLRELNLLLKFHIREYPCHRFGEHRLATSGWSLHEDIVPSGSRDEEGSLRMILTDDMREVRIVGVSRLAG